MNERSTQIWHVSNESGHKGINRTGRIEARPFDSEKGQILAAFYVLSGEAAQIVSAVFADEGYIGYYPQEYSVLANTLEGKEDPYMSIGLYSEQNILLDGSQVGPIRRFFHGFR